MSLYILRQERLDRIDAGRFAPASSYQVVVYKQGATIASDQGPTASLAVQPGHRFATAGGEYGVVARLSGGLWSAVAGSMCLVTAAARTVLTLDTAITVLSGDVLINLGASETGLGSPLWNGSGVNIFTGPDGTVGLIPDSTVNPNTQGEYRYSTLDRNLWEAVISGTTLAELRLSVLPETPDTGFFDVKDYGAVGDGVRDDLEAIDTARQAATTANGRVRFTKGTYRVSSNTTFAYTCTVVMEAGALLVPDAGKTIRIQGPLEAGLWQIFSGSGSVVLAPATSTEVLYGPASIPEAPIQWWGAFPNTTADCGPAIQTALAAICPGTSLTFHGGTFKIATGVALTRRYFNMRGDTGGYVPGAGYPTFIWTGADNGKMFSFTNPLGIRVEMISFDGDFSAATVFEAKSDAGGTVSWNCHFDKCGFIACRGDAFIMGGGHATFNDDFAQALFTNCWFDRPSGRTSDADGNALNLATIPAGRHMRVAAWNSYNVTFDTCHFFSIGTSSDANQYDRIGVYAQGGELAFMNCLFVNRGTDVYVPDPTPGLAIGYVRIIGGESQSEELLRVPVIATLTPNRNFQVENIRHFQSIAGYTFTRTTSISFNGSPNNTQYLLVLVNNKFNHDVELGANCPPVIDIANSFLLGKRYTGAGISKVGGGFGNREAAASTTLTFTSGGTYQILVGDTIVGASSGATAIVEFVPPLTSGSWAGGDAAGTLELRYQAGAFIAENLNVGANLNVATVAGNSVASNWNLFGVGHVLARNGNNILWYHDSYANRFLQNDWWWNHKTSDTALARDALQKYVQGDAQLGKMVTFFGSPNYEGDCTTQVNGAADFVASFAGTTLTLLTKLVPAGFAVYEFIWRVNTGTANNYFDAGVGHIYVMRDTPGAGADSWRIVYQPSTGYDNQGNGAPVALTVTALFNSSGLATIAFVATIPGTERLKLQINAPAADKSSTFYGIIRRIM